MSLFRIFKRKEQQPQSVPSGEVGIVTPSAIYSARDFVKYNPDVLYSYKGAQVYDRMLTDDQVKAAIEFKASAIISREWYFDVIEDPETGEEFKQHREIADFFYTAIDKMSGNFTDRLIDILSAMKYGFAILEKVFQQVDHDGRTYWGLRDLRLLPFHTLLSSIHTDKHGNILKIVQSVAGQDVVLPPEKIIHFVHRPEVDRHYGESDLRAAYRSWWSKDIAMKFWNIYLERAAGGFIWAQVDPAKGALSSNDRDNLEKVLRNLSAMSGIHVPASVTLNAIQPTNTEAYQKAIEQHNQAIARAVLVPNLLGISEQGDVGSYSQSEIQLQAFFWTLNLIATRLEDTLNEQIFRQLAEVNFGTDNFPRFKFRPISEREAEKIASMWADLVSKGAVTRSATDEAHIRQMLGFPEKDQVDENPPSVEDNTSGDDDQDDNPDNEAWIDGKNISDEEKLALRRMFAERPWMKRVDFAAVERIMSDHDSRLAADLAAIGAKVRLSLEDQIARIGGDRSWSHVRPAEIVGVAIPKTLLTAFRKSLRSAFEAAIDDAYEQAKKELPKKTFMRLTTGMDKTQTERFLASKAMKITGVFERTVLDAVQQELENAIKYDRSLKATIQAIEDNTQLLSVLPRVDSAGRAINIPARIENIARTNVADAVNQARMALFTDPALKGFVQAFEYSAILDDRTTEICEMLHGLVRKDWGEFVPPNHFQCRSVLVPVTEVDNWDGKDDPFPAEAAGAKTFPGQIMPPLSETAPVSVIRPEAARTVSEAERYAAQNLLRQPPPVDPKSAAAAMLRANHIGEAVYDGITAEAANLINGRLAELFAGKARLDAIRSDHDIKSAMFAVGRQAIAMPDGRRAFTTLFVNPKYARDLETLSATIERIAGSKTFMIGVRSVDDMLIHEIGHMVDYAGQQGALHSDALVKRYGLDKLKTDAKAVCGSYSQVSQREMFAELYRVWKTRGLSDDLQYLDEFFRKAEDRFHALQRAMS